MLDRDYRVKFITSKNSFLYLSDKDCRHLDQDFLIRVSYGLNKTAYFSLGPPLSSLKEGELALCSVLAKELGIYKNDTVALSTTQTIGSVRRLTIVPETADDYEVLELLAGDVQATLLNQVRIVHNYQRLVVWISNSLHVTVNIEDVSPISPGRLEFLTEIAIMQPTSNTNPAQTPKRGSYTPIEGATLNKPNVVARLLPLSDLRKINFALFEQPFSVYAYRNFLNIPSDSCYTLDIFKMTSIALPQDVAESNDGGGKEIHVRVIAIEDLNYPSQLDEESVYVHETIFSHFTAKFGSKVVLERVYKRPATPNSFEVVTTSNFFSKAAEIARNYLLSVCQSGVIVLNSDVVLKEGDCRFALKLRPEGAFCCVDVVFLRGCKYAVHEKELVVDEMKDTQEHNPRVVMCLDSCNFTDIIKETDRCIKTKLGDGSADCSNVLIVGKPGSGRSALVTQIASFLSEKPNRIHVETLNCKKLKGKNIDSLQKILNSTFVKLIYYQPSILILDDLQVICEKVVEGEAPTQENLHFNKISEMIADFLETHTILNRVALVATATSLANLNQNIFSSRGKHLFKNVLEIKELSKTDRVAIIKYLFVAKEIDCTDVDFELLGVRTEGFVAQDLIDYVDKVIFEAYKDGHCDSESIKITTQYCEDALKNSSTLSLREVQLHSPGERDFNDVGGLEEIKKILVKCMLWPAQYPNIFDKAPLRLQSGLLLYGPPGTGKTILAGAAAKHCKMRLISIKGPELLSKYIGASEQAVRDVFQKAQSAKPCILFFDEFDSLAPRRGRDNTGVTDRVVNQFLTQLDGVESLSGVCVLAATSRPDLLDPALLRPGRLDRQLMCPMPDLEARKAIFQALSKNMHLTKDVNFDKLAQSTVGYSGADLQAVLYTAQLNSVEHLLDNNVVSSSEKTLISQKQLDEAVRSTRPSMTREEKIKYDRIYERFQGKTDILDIKSGKQKTILASA